VGPTGTGKSRLALLAATPVQAPILNADSVQCYEGVQIGANKPSADERRQTPHFLFDWVPVGQSSTAADFREEALKLLRQSDLGPRVFLVGGSGFYLQALEKGMYHVQPVTPQIRAQVDALMGEQGPEALHKELQRQDAAAAARIHPHDLYRTRRALELVLSEGRPLGEIQKQAHESADSGFAGYEVFKTGLYLSRQELREVVEQRTSDMLERGLIEETQSLMARAPAQWSPLESIGYKEVRQFLAGEIPDRESLHTRIVTNTMALAKRQMTWFRRDPKVRWFHARTDWQKAQDYLLGT
jgi:tRNA dimethylallyltransferase